ncbi:MAG: hypothetical protein ABFS32_06760 [Bacteroidota bacterium]
MNREATKIKKKTELKEASRKYQTNLYNEISISSDRIVTFGKNMAVIGGVLYVGYTILDRYLDAQLRTKKKKKEEEKYATLTKILLPLLALALQQGSMILLKKVKTMLIDYLEENKKADV